MQTQSTSANANANLIDLVGVIAGQAAGTTISSQFISDIKEKTDPLNDFLDISPVQAVLFSVIFTLNLNNKSVSLEQIAAWFGSTSLNMASLMDELEELRKKNLLRRDPQELKLENLCSISSMAFTVNPGAFNALRKGEPLPVLTKGPGNNYEVIKAIATEVNHRKENDASFGEMWDKITGIFFTFRRIPILRELRKKLRHHNQWLLFILLCHDYYRGKKTSDLDVLLKLILPEGPEQLELRLNIENQVAEIFTSELIQIREMFARTETEVRLSEKGIRLMTNEKPELVIRRDSDEKKPLLPSGEIQSKNLVFPPAETERLEFLEKMLMPTQFKRLTGRLTSAGMSSGVSILFYGPPGTGKTESAYQLARKTGRDLMPVTISETKSMWFGESEKKIKEVFDFYKKVCSHAKTIPILLFNEADGVFGKRKEAGRSPVDQTENAIQNIILQEMEDLKGIMIATTNMVENFDKAFERRFLYKIRFEKPDILSKSIIWQEKIPWLLKSEALKIAEHDLSGGQIENVARKALMYDVLHRKKAKLVQLEIWCEEEIHQKSIGKVGFKF